jgi:hypothetical protein
MDMDFRVADTFTNNLAKPAGDAQKVVMTKTAS